MHISADGFADAPVGLVVTQFRMIERCNSRFAGIFGYTETDLVGRSVSLLYPSLKEFLDIGEWAHRQMRKDAAYDDQRLMQRRDGSHFWCRVFGQSLTPADPYASCVWAFIDMATEYRNVSLTSREREVAMHVVRGMANTAIADKLEISPRTVEAHRSRIMRKLDVRTTAELISALVGLPL